MTSNKHFIYATSFNVGLAIMAVEMAAGRLLAPYYGTSTMIWSLLIGVVMGSLALGNLLGGWLSKRPSSLKMLYKSFFVVGIIFFLLPLLAPILLSGTLRLFYQGHLFWLAFKVVIFFLLLFLPMLLLGATTPVLAHHLVDNTDEIGKNIGHLYALSTLGSLLGTFLSGIFLVPLWGVRQTFWLFAILLFLNGLGAFFKARTFLIFSLFLLGIFSWSFFLSFGNWHSEEQGKTLFEGESHYNHIWVTRKRGMIRLLLNEGFAVQSLSFVDGRLPLVDVWAYYALAPAWTLSGNPKKILLIGLGGGSSARILRAFFPKARIVGVEQDPKVVEVGRRFLGMPKNIEVKAEGGRVFLSRTSEHFDLVIVDAFQFPYIPFQLATREFFRLIEGHLAVGGALVMNVGRHGRSYDVVDSIVLTLRSVFPHVLGVDLSNDSNTIVVATRHHPRRYAGLKRMNIPIKWQERLKSLPSPHFWRYRSHPLLLTDNVAPVEWLTDRIIFRQLLHFFKRR